jgi:dipeptidyl aminopeptidase/acylaminoacyl peptidase
VLIQIHGGPESQALPGFNPLIEYYVREQGISVLVPNVRGSSGYGKAYLKLDDGAAREDSVKDIGSLLDWIATQPALDAKRVAVMGGSYGGYMTLAAMAFRLAAMTHYNERLRGGVSIVGISNFVTFLTNTQDYRRDLRRAEYGDERDPQMRAVLERISPTANAAKITKPMFIVQGANDPRVPASESEQMVKTIRRNGGEVWFLLAKDEGHGFKKKSNRDAYTNATAVFLERVLN